MNHQLFLYTSFSFFGTLKYIPLHDFSSKCDGASMLRVERKTVPEGCRVIRGGSVTRRNVLCV